MDIKVLVADDEILIRHLYITALNKYEDVKIVGQAANGEDVMKLLKNTQPDVLLLDLHMPRISGVEVLKQIHSESINVNTLVISMEEDNKVIKNVIDAGALGFLSKTEDWDEMYNAIKKVSRGEFYYSEKINPILLEMIHEHKQQTPTDRIEFNEREANIIHYLNEGLSSADIGEKLYCSRATVDRIRQALIHRVGAKNTAGLLIYAIRHKLVEVDSL